MFRLLFKQYPGFFNDWCMYILHGHRSVNTITTGNNTRLANTRNINNTEPIRGHTNIQTSSGVPRPLGVHLFVV